jgi:hypothetical protein
MEIGLILFLAFGGYWITKLVKKNMYDPLDERIKKLEKLVMENKSKKRSKYD